jgi:hypothetical protein
VKEDRVQLEMSLTDVAALAGVRRAVVSVWRTRSAGGDQPFPDSLQRVGGEERFLAADVVTWLSATGRGKNPEARADVAAYAMPTDLDPRQEPAVFAGLTALLCLKATNDRALSGLPPDVLMELAQQADPDDAFLVREIAALSDRMEAAAEYADLLAEAAFGPAAALDRLLGQRFRLAQKDLVAVSVAEPVHGLISAVARALARECAAEPARYVDPTASGSDLLVSVATADDAGWPEVVLLRGASTGARALRRRLRSREVHVATAASLVDMGPAVVVAHHPGFGPRATTAEAILDAVDDLALSLTDEQRGLVLAPASVLTDDLGDRHLQQLRSRVLRTGRVRASVRLPAGLVPHRSREALALWALGPDRAGERAPGRSLVMADVSDSPLTPLIIDQVRDDVLAAMVPPERRRAHSWAVSRLLTTGAVLAQSGSLFSTRMQVAPATTHGADVAVRIEALRPSPAEQGDALGGLALEPEATRTLPAIAVGDALRRGLLRALPGNREGFESLDPAGTVPVLGVDELVGAESRGARRVDRLAFLGGRSAARLTEAGDVVFCTSPRPRALVDVGGGSAVQYPARILRVDPVHGEGLCPPVIAHAINSQIDTSRAWRSWSLPRLPDAAVPTAAEALLALDHEEDAVRTRLAELDELRHLLVQGLASGSFALTGHDPTATDQKDG